MHGKHERRRGAPAEGVEDVTIEVDPDALDRLAATFAGQAQTLGDAVRAFEQATANTGGAFGLIGPSSDVEQEYLDTIPDAAQALYDLRAALTATEEGLHTSAANYRQAEADSTMPGPGAVLPGP